MANVEVRRSTVKIRLKRVEIATACFCDRFANPTHASIVDGVAPGVIRSEFQAYARHTPAIDAHLKSVVRGVSAVAASQYVTDDGIQARTVQVVRADDGDSVGGDSRVNTSWIQQPPATSAIEIVSGVKPAAARTDVRCPDDECGC